MRRRWIHAVATAAYLVALTIATMAHASAISWRLLSGAPAFPPSLPLPVGVYDATRQRVLVIDGNWDSTVDPLVVRVFTPSASPHWSVLPALGTVPLTRYVPAIVMDPVRNRLLVIGMARGQAIDVWALVLSGTPTWRQLATPAAGPPPMYGHSAIFDAAHDRVVVFGGGSFASGSTFFSDVWLFSLTTDTWTHSTILGDAPEGREGHGAVYDPVRKRMIVFGGHTEAGGSRRFFDDLWSLSLGDSLAWSRLEPSGAIPGARSAFGMVYDPMRRRMLVHAGINAQSGIEPDDLWALSLDAPPVWTPIVAANTLRGRSYPVDVYDRVQDRLLACGGSGYAQTSALPLANTSQWVAVDPPVPLPAPSAHSGSSVLYDARRDRFLVAGGSFSVMDSAVWHFTFEGRQHWEPIRSPGAPWYSWGVGTPTSTTSDSLGDRLLLFDGGRVFAESAGRPNGWTQLGPWVPEDWTLGFGAGIAVDTRRNRLIVTGGHIFYPNSAGYSMLGVWALDLGASPAWTHIGELPFTSEGHATWYDAVHDRLIVFGGVETHDIGRFGVTHGAVVWATPLDSALHWSKLGRVSDGELPAPPNAQAAFDERGGRIYLAIDSTLWSRGVDDTVSWTRVELVGDHPMLTSNALAFDPKRKALLALFAPLSGSDRVNAWSLEVGGRRSQGFADEPAVDALPRALGLELLGTSPSPAIGELRLAFCLPAAVSTQLEVFDLLGRRRFAQDVGALSAGKQVVRLAGSERWDAGVYFARLRCGAEQRTMRVVLIR